MTYVYVLTPFVSWLLAGSLKFLVNSLQGGKAAVAQIGNGGMPSNHSAIVSSILVLIVLKEGFDSPAAGLAVAFAFIVMLDAGGLRRHLEVHARALQQLSEQKLHTEKPRLRLGHSVAEILGGIVVGAVVGWLMSSL